MPKTTKKGQELADLLNQGYTNHIFETCSLLCRAATSYARIQEANCNGHPLQSDPSIDPKRMAKIQERFEKWCEKREEQLEKLIDRHALNLPGVLRVIFNGDPRGNTVKLVMSEEPHGTDWGQDGIGVPGS